MRFEWPSGYEESTEDDKYPVYAFLIRHRETGRLVMFDLGMNKVRRELVFCS